MHPVFYADLIRLFSILVAWIFQSVVVVGLTLWDNPYPVRIVRLDGYGDRIGCTTAIAEASAVDGQFPALVVTVTDPLAPKLKLAVILRNS